MVLTSLTKRFEILVNAHKIILVNYYRIIKLFMTKILVFKLPFNENDTIFVFRLTFIQYFQFIWK